MSSSRSGSLKSRDSELRAALKASRGAFGMTGFFSLFINLLALTAPLYMLQVYDRVLGSRSESTLIGLTVIAAGMLAVLGILDLIRSRVLVRIGGRLDASLHRRIFSSVFARGFLDAGSAGSQPLRDLDTLRHFLTGSGPFAFFDAPWMPVYLAVIFLLHPILGAVATGGALLLVALALLNDLLTRKPLQHANVEAARAGAFADTSLRNAEVLEALGMLGGVLQRWRERRQRALGLQALASDRAGSLSAASKALRLLLQIAILGAGAALAIRQEITPGSMIAASIIMGRALLPVEQAIANWRGLLAARSAYLRIEALLEENPERPAKMRLPAPEGRLAVDHLAARPPGAEKPVLTAISFELQPGEALGVLGPTASGKTTLARHLVGVSRPAGGSVRLDGAELSDWDAEVLGPHIGYLPQDIELFDGSVAENIARFETAPDSERIVRAARRAGAHEMILQLPGGYDTRIGAAGCALSGGQRQRLGLARALYGDPALVVLDEPNSNLDAEGDEALTRAILDLKQGGSTVVVMAHRPSAIAGVDKLLVLGGGTMRAFGPKLEILKEASQRAGPSKLGPAR